MKINNICCIGAGFVGGPTMAVIALKCPEIKVTVVDKSKERILAWNSKNLDLLPVYEPGLTDIIKETRGKNLYFSTDIDNAIISSELIFIAVNTPTKTKGKGKGKAADLTFVELCAKKIGEVSMSDKIVVEKSTLPVRTAERIKEILSSFKKSFNFEILSNPEFLAEGTAINDLFKSDRVLIGGENTLKGKKAVKVLYDIYSRWIPKNKILTTNVWSSELTKLASNAMLAQRISSINSLSALCEKTGARIDEVSKGIGMDSRIGPEFLNASVSFGGSCFKKDILNLVYLCQYYDLNEVAEFWNQVIIINDYQRNRFIELILKNLDYKIKDKKITLLGWSFKKNTNDSRESTSIYIASELLKKGSKVHVYDPKVNEEQIINDLNFLWNNSNIDSNYRKLYLKNLFIQNNHLNAIKSSHGVIVLTEWDEFKFYKWNNLLKLMKKSSKIFDGRNILPNSISEKQIYRLGITQQ